MSLKTWRNGADASVVRKITEDNFKIVAKHLHQNMLSLTTDERLLLGREYLSDGLVVYDKDLKTYYEYVQSTGLWKAQPKAESKSYSLSFTEQDWNDNSLYIPFTDHAVSDPMVQIFMLVNGTHQPVMGGIEIDTNFNITLSTDMPFSGKVVVK